MKNLHVHVDWNGSPLYDEDHDGGSFSDTFTYDMKWDVPSYAPNGDYVVTITGQEDDGSTDLCVKGLFTFE